MSSRLRTRLARIERKCGPLEAEPVKLQIVTFGGDTPPPSEHRWRGQRAVMETIVVQENDDDED